MKTRHWLVFVAMALAGLTLLLAAALLSYTLIAVAAVPSATLTPTPTHIPRSVSASVLAAPNLVAGNITFSPARPGEEEGVDITVTVSGTHPVYAWVDRDGDVEESDETNNLAGPVYIPVGTLYSPDAYEDDDLCSQANPIAADGTDQQHNLYPAPDKDWVKFDAIGGVTYRAQAIADGADADLVIELHGDCASPPSFGSGSEIKFTAAASGTYYFKVEHVSADYGDDTEYDLRITALDFCNGHHEPNDTCATAADVAVGAAPQTHTFCRTGDADWARFPTTAGSTYVISATHVGADANAQLSLYTRCGAPPLLTDGQRLKYTALTGGFAYVKAENLDPATYGPGTEYALQVVRVSDCAPDAHEPDDTAATAGTLVVGDPAQTHDICPAGDADWVSFDATASVIYTMETLNLAGAADTVLCLFDASGTTQLACDDDSGPGKGSRIVWQAPADGTYALRVTDYDADVAGPETRYDLRVFAGPCLDDEWEPDDTQATARPIDTDGSRQPHNTCPAGDVDWVYFTTPASRQVIETTDLGPEADTFIELYDASGRRLAFNDDYGPGTASRIHYTFGSGGTYYVRVRHYNPTRYGTGTEYSLRVYWDGLPPYPTPEPPTPPTVTPSPTPPPSGVRTIILVNREQVAALHGEMTATQLITKLNALAQHSDVQGEVIRLDLNDTVRAAYAAWTADFTSTIKANQVTAAIRGVIMTYLQQRAGVENIVLFGDDQLLPFRRIRDHTTISRYPEQKYGGVNDEHPTGAALRANYFLTDDYYADRDPTPFRGRELYIPDLAIGRLIETPDEIIAFIDEFLDNSQITLGQVLVTGYDFVKDTARANCRDWRAELGPGSVDCSLIGDSWTADDLRARQLTAAPPFKVQSINGHADHYREGAPHGQPIDAGEISSASSDLSRGLIYTLGCHSGLNVPPENGAGSLDLAQAFARKKANYVANTGYAWGLHIGIGLSEKLMRLYTDELRRGESASMGQALAAAKRRYHQEDWPFTSFDEKILEESIFYGLPMYRLNTSSVFGPTDDPFPSVDITSSLPGAFGDETVVSGTVDIQLTDALGPSDVMSRAVTADGVYYLLDGHAHAVSGQPVQPLLYADVTAAGWPARSVIFRGGEYETLTDFDPVVVSPVNDYLTQTTEAAFDDPGWYPGVPAGLQNQGGRTSLVAQMGQYHPAAGHDPSAGQARLYSSMELDLYYSLSTDQTPPRFTVVDGLYDRATGQVNLKVGAIDWTGVQRAVATYTRGDGRWDSVELSFDRRLHKWTGSFPGDTDSRYLVQVMDGAGNVAQATNKGLYYAPAVAPTPAVSVYLPLVLRH